MTYIGIIEWWSPTHKITEHSIVAISHGAAIEHFETVAGEGAGELICVHAIVPVYTRQPQAPAQ